ncbi:MAG: C1 family peptidase [Oligoflexia bacterium]|nr:C1 family peptidase [Oligoflexia bacterium]
MKLLNGNSWSLAASFLFLAAALPTHPALAMGKAPPPPASYDNTLMAEQTVGPVVHSAVEDQGDVGFCWAYSLSGLMEAESLKRGTKVTLSPEYLALNHMYYMINTYLPLFAQVDQAGSLGWLLKWIVEEIFNPQGNVNLTMALRELAITGTMPESAFQYKFPFAVDAQGKRHEIHPTLQERLQTFTSKNLFDKNKVAAYQANPELLRTELFNALGVTVPQPADSFTYEGASYTPMTFMSTYLAFNPGNYEEVAVLSGKYNSVTSDNPVLGYTHDQAMRIIESALRDGVSVPIAFLIYSDQLTAEQTGVFTPQDCDGDSCKTLEGGHAVLAIGLKETSQQSPDPIDALIIKNSWGTVGLDDHGEVTQDPAQRGFFLVSSDYLREAENQPKTNGWSFVVPKTYLRGAP